MRFMLCAVLAALCLSLSPAPCRAQAKKDSAPPVDYTVAYEKALSYVRSNLDKAHFPAKMVAGWTLLADGRYPDDLRKVLNEAMQWERKRANIQHGTYFFPALAGMLLAEQFKHEPTQEIRDALDAIVKEFQKGQETTGGWYKWKEGAFRDGKLVYPVSDLGMLTSMVYGFLWTVKKLGITVPQDMMQLAGDCLAKNLSDGGISYGTGQRSADPTGARGAFVLIGLDYAGEKKHAIYKTYAALLPKRIPAMDKGHHIGAFHCLGATLGCHTLGANAKAQLTGHWVAALAAKQDDKGGLFVGDDGADGGEAGLLGGNVGSTAAFALMITLRDRPNLWPGETSSGIDMTVRVERELHRKLAKAVEAAGKGELARAIKDIDALLAKENTPDDVKKDAQALHAAVSKRIETCMADADACMAGKDFARAVRLLEAVSAALKDCDAGQPARDKIASINADPAQTAELAASKALEKVLANARDGGFDTVKPLFRRLIETYPDSRAAAQARVIVGDKGAVAPPAVNPPEPKPDVKEAPPPVVPAPNVGDKPIGDKPEPEVKKPETPEKPAKPEKAKPPKRTGDDDIDKAMRGE